MVRMVALVSMCSSQKTYVPDRISNRANCHARGAGRRPIPPQQAPRRVSTVFLRCAVCRRAPGAPLRAGDSPRGAALDRRVISGILWRFRTGAPWRDVPERYGPRTTLYNHFVRWRAADVWDKLLEALSAAYDGDIVMIDSSCVRVHRHGVGIKNGAMTIVAWDVPGVD